MVEIVVKNSAGLSAALQSAKAGDTIKLMPGNYGDVSISSKNFATDVTITSADAKNPAVMSSLFVYKSSGINIDNVDVNFKPDADTLLHQSAVRISNSSDIEFTNGQIKGGPAVSGVPQTATQLDSTGNVIGLPTARGITIEWSKDVKIVNSDVGSFHKGIVLNSSSELVIQGNAVHDVRTGTISGSNLNNVVVDGNTLSNSTPWNLGGKGDHADFIHFWTDPNKQTAASENITITNNKIVQDDGQAIMAIYIDDNGNKLGFKDVTIAHNVILNGNGIGVLVENTFDSNVTDNVLLQSSGDSRDAPGIFLTSGSHHVDVTGNLTSYIKDGDGTNAGFIHDNVQVQKFDPTSGGFYSTSTVDSLMSATSTVSAKATALSGLTAATSEVTEKAVNAITQTASSDAGVKLTAKSGGANFLYGGKGADTLAGGTANDSLSGGDGNDLLKGNAGADSLRGGAGGDTFSFDDNIVGSDVDTIFDFRSAEGDKINVHSMDANTATTRDDDFRFIGTTGFSHSAGELRYEIKGADAYLMGDVNGDGVADFSIKLVGVGSLTRADLSL